MKTIVPRVGGAGYRLFDPLYADDSIDNEMDMHEKSREI